LPANPISDPGNPEVTHKFDRLAESIHVETRKGDHVWRAVVDYAFGSRDRFMTLVGRDQHGRSRMLRISHYESTRGSGWDLATGFPTRPEDEQEYLGKPMLERDGVRRCLFCHTTNFRAVLDQTGPEAADHSIGCEKCHGPGGHHVAAAGAGISDLAIVSPGQATAINEMCGNCHNLHNTTVISAPRTDPVWYRFQARALAWSRCYTESGGNLSCVTCHDPHRSVETSAARNEAKCFSCHARDPRLKRANQRDPTVPTHRAGQSDAKQPPSKASTACPINAVSGCIDCHMPSMWQQSIHSFKTDHFIRVRGRLPSEN
jgi:predicted CXXCH cytochrome family protein